MAEAEASRDGTAITVKVPMTFRHRGGRKLVVVPDGYEWRPAARDLDDPLIRALARAWRWKRMLESGRYASITELAEAENNNQAYVGRMLRLTLLAPDIIEPLLERAGGGLAMDALLRPMPTAWSEQLRHIGLARSLVVS